ncbi:MAG: aromatic aminobenezylarsenical efflux permease ArsG family transporter [Prevotella sp.]|nr:aromatic aminobenezylarsenical efflux permease ArsG family transporter [Prevotella sp.]
MEWLQTLVNDSSTPVFTAFLLGLLTAVSPCPLATNIAAVGYISKDVASKSRIFVNGMLYSFGRVLAYTLLGAALILIIRQGADFFGVQSALAAFGSYALGPVLIVIGVLMIVAPRLRLPQSGVTRSPKRALSGGWDAMLLGILFALAFCPTSGVFYFGMLIPMSAVSAAGYLLPVVFALATALPVLLFAWVLAFSVHRVGTVYGRIQLIQKWLSRFVSVLFIGLGIYYCYIIFIH